MLQDDFVRVRKKDLDKLTTEVMQLKEFLPRVLNRDLFEAIHKARATQTSIDITIVIVTSSKGNLHDSWNLWLYVSKTKLKKLQV